ERAPEVFDGDSVSIDSAGGSPLPTLDDDAAPGSDPPPCWTDFDETDAHIVYLTSGTTGTPKGVVVSHRASWLRAFPGGSTFADGLRGRGGILAAFPLFHYGGWHFVLEAWQHGCAFHACERFDGETIASVASKQRPSAMYCIPALWERVLDAAGQGDLASVVHADTGTSAAPPDLIARIKRHLPQATTSVLYGSSEGGHHTTLFDWDLEDRPGSVGRAAPPGAVRVDGNGEILYRSPTLMTGYLNRPDETHHVLRDGWYHTGDLGVMDEDGYLYITGRLREVIRTGGETVSPSEVEAELRSFPGIEDLAVVGLPDGTWGEIVTAAVVCAPGSTTPGVAELRDHLGDRLAAFKHPRAVIAIDRIPRTPATGQVQRTLLVDELMRSPGQNRTT
ncbi:MAG TPA: class I adenylate-forming enzyme family protein, partial [Acidimicrobiales bacterium]|nr:class I adenylate-forming enzyme family protein [Acidimicrobiales bacterium]